MWRRTYIRSAVGRQKFGPQDHNYMNLPFKNQCNITCITVCVDYDDFLKVSLPINTNLLPGAKWIIVSADKDQATQKLVKEYNCEIFNTSAFWDNGAKFNKAKALNQAINHFKPQRRILFWDCDVVFPTGVGHLISKAIDSNCIYSLGRAYTETYAQWERIKNNWETSGSNVWWPGCDLAGYFLLFNSQAVRRQVWFDEEWSHAGGYDTEFQRLWPLSHRVCLPGFVNHLGSPEVNWFGRTAPRFFDGVATCEDKVKVEKLNLLNKFRDIRGKVRDLNVLKKWR